MGGLGGRVTLEEAFVAAASEDCLTGERAELRPVSREVSGLGDVENW